MEGSLSPKLIITDFDGVILDSEAAKTEAFQECLAIFPQHVEQFMEYHFRNFGMNRYEKLQYFYEVICKEDYTEAKRNFITQRFNKIIFEKVVNSPFVLGALEFIKAYSPRVIICIVSATPKEELIKVLRYLGLIHCVHEVYSVPPMKKIILAEILKKYALSPEEAIFIGDRNDDLQAAKANQIPFIGKSGTEPLVGPMVAEIDGFVGIESILKIAGDISPKSE
jgi:phosphoglycolate phosphatase